MTDELNLATFSPTIAELQSLVAVAQEVDINNLNAVTSVRISLKSARVRIEKRGKEYRADAVKFQKAVIAKEHELVAIIEPEETRLEAIEEEVKAKKLREERIALLPERKKRIAEIIGSEIVALATLPEFRNWALQDIFRESVERRIVENRPPDERMFDEILVEMDNTEFQVLLNNLFTAKNEAERLRIEHERADFERDRAKLARDREIAEEVERTRVEERERASRAITEEREAADRRAKEAEARAVEAAREAERRVQAEKDAWAWRDIDRTKREVEEAKRKRFTEEAEQKALENQEAYKAFMDKHGLLNDVSMEHLQQFYILNDNSDPTHPRVKLYKLVDVLELKI